MRYYCKTGIEKFESGQIVDTNDDFAKWAVEHYPNHFELYVAKQAEQEKEQQEPEPEKEPEKSEPEEKKEKPKRGRKKWLKR